MDHPKFIPKFIPLDNQHPDMSCPCAADKFAKFFRHNAYGSRARYDLVDDISKYITKCREYFGEEIGPDYFSYKIYKSLSDRFFPDKEFLGPDPDPVYSAVFAEYFTVQKKLREDMAFLNIKMEEQVLLLTELSQLHNEKLALARKRFRMASRGAAKNKNKNDADLECGGEWEILEKSTNLAQEVAKLGIQDEWVLVLV